MRNSNKVDITKHTSFITVAKTTGDIEYHKAQEIIKNMLDLKLISIDEYNKITEINRKTFSPILAEIMPKIT